MQTKIPKLSTPGCSIIGTLPGASDARGPNFKLNESLIAAAVVRAAQFQHMPCFIGADLNCNPADSAVLQVARGHEIIFDLVALSAPVARSRRRKRAGLGLYGAVTTTSAIKTVTRKMQHSGKEGWD